ncbi:MAG: hypothetical protein ABJA66_20230 [Actinomycetota bacterium]
MQTFPKYLIVIFVAFFFSACPSNNGKTDNGNSPNRTANSANSINSANAVKDDIDELEMTIKIPFHPEEAVWREEMQAETGDGRVPAPTDKKLVAVLRFLKEDAEKIAAQAVRYKPAQPETISTENWFPAELIAQSRTSGDGTLKGASYAANDFFNTPYNDGKITRIEGTNYFVLELYAK